MAENHIFSLPDLGEGLTEAELVAWHVELGQVVALNQPLVEVETAKAGVEVPSPYAGTVSELHAAIGDVVDVGAPLVTITAGAAPPEAARPAPEPVAKPSPERVEPRPEAEEASGAVLVGYGTSVAANGGRRRVPYRPLLPEPANGGRPLATPPIRKLAKDLGVELTALAAGGEPVTRERVRAAAEARTDTPEPGVEVIPLRGVRRTIAARLTRARTEIPEATSWIEVDATELMRLRVLLEPVLGTRPSPLVLILRAVTAALRRHPVLNGHFDTEAQEIRRHERVHLGVAADTERGLVVPVIRDADRLSVAGLAAETTRLTQVARQGTLSPAELTGGTFTVNNYGTFGVDGADPIINHPEIAILGIGRIRDLPWAVDGEVAVRKVARLTLSFDHRVCDGGEAGGFLRLLGDLVESPAALIAHL